MADRRIWAALRATAANDPVAQWTIAAFVVVSLLYLAPGSPPSVTVFLTWRLAPALFVGLALLAVLAGLPTLSGEAERAFWKDLAAGLAFWLGATLIDLVFLDFSLPFQLSLDDVLYASYYVAVLLAIERKPHLSDRWRPSDLERRLVWPAVTSFVFALATYFIVVPLHFTRTTAGNLLYAAVLYPSLDAYIAARIFSLCRSIESRRWASLYTLLGVAWLGIFLIDLIEGLQTALGGEAVGDHPANLLWNVPLVLLALVARVRHRPELADAGGRSRRVAALAGLPFEKTIVFALLLPLIHISCSLSGLVDPGSMSYREAVVLAWLVVLATIAAVQHHFFDRRSRDLRRERIQAEKAARISERDLRFHLERQTVLEAIRDGEELFRQTFQPFVDMVALHSAGSGRFLEVDFGARALLGYSEDELAGRTLRELGLLEHRRDEVRLARELRERGRLDRFELDVRDRSGGVRRLLVSARPLSVAGQSCFLSVSRDLGPEIRARDDARHHAELLDEASRALAEEAVR